jgi:hypothetical protein
MIVHAMSSYDLCSLDMMFYGYESMFMIYIYIYSFVKDKFTNDSFTKRTFTTNDNFTKLCL